MRIPLGREEFVNRKTNDDPRKASATILFVAVVLLTVSCTEYNRVARSDWDSASLNSPADWKIETTTMIYTAKEFMTTDSTLIVTAASRVELVGGTNYPGNSTRGITNSELPIVLPLDDVVSIEQGQFSKGHTVAAVLGVTAATCIAAAVAMWIYAESHGGFD
jgi:hypothetical protein